MDLELAGKRALVTGASSGIGTAIATLLGAEGVTVLVHGRHAERAEAVVDVIRKAGGTAEALIGSLASTEEVNAVADAALRDGGVDILVNNAGGRTNPGPESWDDLNVDEWAKTYQLNVISPAVLASRLLVGMRDQGWGRIIQISSIAALIVRPDTPDYGASKAGLNHLTVNLSVAVANTGITVNTISPGAVATPPLRRVLAQMAEDNGWTGTPKEIERLGVRARWRSNAGRLAEPVEIASAVAFLASPLAGFINGVNLRVDGGKQFVL